MLQGYQMVEVTPSIFKNYYGTSNVTFYKFTGSKYLDKSDSSNSDIYWMHLNEQLIRSHLIAITVHPYMHHGYRRSR